MICENCIHYKVCKYKTKTIYECEHFADGTIKNQYDRIRNMSIEEMADFLMNFVTEALTNPKCIVVQKWLESEVDTE